MKFLFIVQGEGRGHLTQAITVEEMLLRNGHEVVEVLVGKSNVRRLPEYFSRSIQAPVKRFASPNFLPVPANRKVNLSRSIVYNLLRTPVYCKSICYLRHRIKESGADMVINFYELLTGLTYLVFPMHTPYICIGHQYLFLHQDFRFPDKNKISIELLKLFTRMTSIGAKERLALSFRSMADDEMNGIRVIPPLLRREVMLAGAKLGDYIHGYMVNSGYGEAVIAWHRAHLSIPLYFFWDKTGEPDVKKVDDTLTFQQINDREFLNRLASCKAYATTAGFESVCEAMFLRKPLMMVPVHIEQECNAYDAACSGAGIISEDFSMDGLLEFTKTYKPNMDFIRWARSCEGLLMYLINRFSSSMQFAESVPVV